MDEAAPATLGDLLNTSDGPIVAMVMTMVGREHSSRPVQPTEVGDHRLTFIVDRSLDWVSAIAREQALLHVTVADDRRGLYIALNGCAEVEPRDGNEAALHFDVERGEYWSMSGAQGDSGITFTETMKGAIHGQVLGSSKGPRQAGGR
jgi:hypothetical protein